MISDKNKCREYGTDNQDQGTYDSIVDYFSGIKIFTSGLCLEILYYHNRNSTVVDAPGINSMITDTSYMTVVEVPASN